MSSAPIQLRQLSSWGGIAQNEYPAATPQFPDAVADTLSALTTIHGSALAFGCGRSYGDSCLNGAGGMLCMTGLDRVHHFDLRTGILRADAGLTLAELHKLIIPRGWFAAVTPGTQFVTLGGAVANDVHGKNHHQAGTFGSHVLALGLRRSDGTEMLLTPEQELFAPTVGGLGLTGVIEWVELQLQPLISTEMDYENLRFAALDDFFHLSAASEDWPYVVAWLDCLSPRGRGVLCRARHAPDGGLHTKPSLGPKLPITLPVSLVNGATVRAFNSTYFHRRNAQKRGRQHLQDFFYPLDGVRHWNRIYGRLGFYQYQCVLPPDTALHGVRRILDITRAANEGSFLVVIKNLGARPSPGMLSFPQPGTTLALDFVNGGTRTLELLAAFDEVVALARGRLYPAKDGRMPAAMFQNGYPNWKLFRTYLDPGLRSDFWARVSVEGQP